jgi:hypothetical protein
MVAGEGGSCQLLKCVGARLLPPLPRPATSATSATAAACASATEQPAACQSVGVSVLRDPPAAGPVLSAAPLLACLLAVVTWCDEALCLCIIYHVAADAVLGVQQQETYDSSTNSNSNTQSATHNLSRLQPLMPHPTCRRTHMTAATACLDDCKPLMPLPMYQHTVLHGAGNCLRSHKP